MQPVPNRKRSGWTCRFWGTPGCIKHSGGLGECRTEEMTVRTTRGAQNWGPHSVGRPRFHGAGNPAPQALSLCSRETSPNGRILVLVAEVITARQCPVNAASHGGKLRHREVKSLGQVLQGRRANPRGPAGGHTVRRAPRASWALTWPQIPSFLSSTVS